MYQVTQLGTLLTILLQNFDQNYIINHLLMILSEDGMPLV